MLILCARQEEHFQRNLSGLLEFWVRIEYNIDVNKKESTHSKSGYLNGIVSTLYRARPSCELDRVGIYLLTLSFVQKGKQRDNKAAERNQQSEDTKDYHYDFVSCHTHHLPSYVFPYGS